MHQWLISKTALNSLYIQSLHPDTAYSAECGAWNHLDKESAYLQNLNYCPINSQ